jgi:hypothetical protein
LAKGELGTIMQPPGYVVDFADGWEGDHRNVPSLKGWPIFCWVKFDQAQIDADGDGLYDEAEINSDYLIRLENQSVTSLCRPSGARESFRSVTPGLRPGLLSAAASRLVESSHFGRGWLSRVLLGS